MFEKSDCDCIDKVMIMAMTALCQTIKAPKKNEECPGTRSLKTG